MVPNGGVVSGPIWVRFTAVPAIVRVAERVTLPGFRATVNGTLAGPLHPPGGGAPSVIHGTGLEALQLHPARVFTAMFPATPSPAAVMDTGMTVDEHVAAAWLKVSVLSPACSDALLDDNV